MRKPLKSLLLWKLLFIFAVNRFIAMNIKIKFTEEETLIIATHGIIKKTQKTPTKEIIKAESIRKEYFENKRKG